jgi:cyclopropane-fatty-acyl-phospholipid synthase
VAGPQLTYSAAIFDGDYSMPLEQAQARKYQRVINTLGLRAGDRAGNRLRLGRFAEHAARQGIRVHGLTISPSQLQVAQQRIAAAGLPAGAAGIARLPRHRGPVRCRGVDRNVRGGRRAFWPQYFDTVQRA